jgi:hypothetical protein
MRDFVVPLVVAFAVLVAIAVLPMLMKPTGRAPGGRIQSGSAIR